jgi:hypothetical protein
MLCRSSDIDNRETVKQWLPAFEASEKEKSCSMIGENASFSEQKQQQARAAGRLGIDSAAPMPFLISVIVQAAFPADGADALAIAILDLAAAADGPGFGPGFVEDLGTLHFTDDAAGPVHDRRCLRTVHGHVTAGDAILVIQRRTGATAGGKRQDSH